MDDDFSSSAKVQELATRIENSTSKLRTLVPEDAHGSTLVRVLRCMDQAQVYMMAKREWPEGWLQQLRFGTSQALALFVPAASAAADVPNPPHIDARAKWASSILIESGSLALAHLWTEYARCGLATLHRTSSDRYVVNIDGALGVEAIERRDLEWFSNHVANGQNDAERALDQQEPEIWRQLSSEVRQCGTLQLSEGAGESIEYFCRRAALIAERSLGYDYFPDNARFGTVTFLTLKRAIVAQMSRALYDCYRILAWHEVSGNPLDTLRGGRWLDRIESRKSVVDFFCHALEIEESDSSRIVEMLTLDPKLTGTDYPKIPNAANPPFVTVGGNHLARSLMGSLNAPIQFLLTRLFLLSRPGGELCTDWTRAAQDNEEVLREKLYALFPGDRFLRIHKNIPIREGGNDVTDIDALVMDRETGVAGVFQLKWWMTFGASMTQRQSRATNLAKEESWVHKTASWIGRNGLAELAERGNFTRADRKRLKDVRLFMLGRYFSTFSDPAPAEDGAARGNWAQVVRLTSNGLQSQTPIDALWDALRRDSPHSRRTRLDGRATAEAWDFTVTLETGRE